jgi:hypothetical protein
LVFEKKMPFFDNNCQKEQKIGCGQKRDFCGICMYSENRVFAGYNSKNRFLQNPIFAVNFAETFLQCPPLLTHRVLGSNPAFEQNRIFAEFFAVYRENRVFRPHRISIKLKT